MLIDFLANLIPKAHIIDLTFKDKEKPESTEQGRKPVYDIYCENNYRN